MSDLDSRLRGDGARWREGVDGRHRSDPGVLLDQVTSAEVRQGGVFALRDRFPGRSAVLLSVAAVTVLAIAVGGGVAVLIDGRNHPGHPALAATSSSPQASIRASTAAHPLPSASTKAGHAAHTSTAAHRPGDATPRANSSTERRPTRHKQRTRTSTSTSASRSATTSTSAGAGPPPPCDPAALTVSVTAPAAAGDQASLTVSVSNSGAATCTISGFPTIQFSGDSTVTAAATDETPEQVTLLSGGSATAGVSWSDTSTTGTCVSYPSALVSPPGGTASALTLAPPAQVCDVSTPVVHPLAAG